MNKPTPSPDPAPGLLHVEPCALTADMRKALADSADLPRRLRSLLPIYLLIALLSASCIAAFLILGAMMDAQGWIPAADAGRSLAFALVAGLGSQA